MYMNVASPGASMSGASQGLGARRARPSPFLVRAQPVLPPPFVVRAQSAGRPVWIRLPHRSNVMRRGVGSTVAQLNAACAAGQLPMDQCSGGSYVQTPAYALPGGPSYIAPPPQGPISYVQTTPSGMQSPVTVPTLKSYLAPLVAGAEGPGTFESVAGGSTPLQDVLDQFTSEAQTYCNVYPDSPDCKGGGAAAIAAAASKEVKTFYAGQPLFAPAAGGGSPSGSGPGGGGGGPAGGKSSASGGAAAGGAFKVSIGPTMIPNPAAPGAPGAPAAASPITDFLSTSFDMFGFHVPVLAAGAAAVLGGAWLLSKR
jgi:hypothetical protein